MRKNVLILGHNDATQFIDIYNQYTRIFDQNKYAVTVVYLSGEPNEATRQRTIAENVIFLNVAKKNLRGLKIQAIRRLLALCRAKKFEIVICHRYKPAYCMMWVSLFCRIPHLYFVMHELGTMAARGRQFIIAALRRNNMIFAGVSNAVRDDIRHHLWPVAEQRITTLYNVIDVDMTEPEILSRAAAREALNIGMDEFVFGNIARLFPNKDQKNLISAFAAVCAMHPHSKLVIIGKGELEEALKQQAKACGLEDKIIFTGFLPGGFRYMKAFDCFVLPSIQEAFGRVLLEAMLAKLPVIATRVHGIPEVLADQGCLIAPRDTAALGQAMQDILMLSDEERAKVGARAHQHVIENFSIAAFAKQFWDYHHSIFQG